MTILFRAESGKEVGLGHLIRSLVIARRLKDVYPEVDIFFLTREDFLSIKRIVDWSFKYCVPNGQDEETFLLNSCQSINPDLLFIDHMFNYKSETIQILSGLCKVVLFHNLCEGAHFCDAVIYPSINIDNSIWNNAKWQNNKTKVFTGLKYVVLNNEITSLTMRSKINNNVKTIAITTGGSDPTGIMLKLLEWLSGSISSEIIVYALIGDSFFFRAELDLLKPSLKENIHLVPYNVEFLQKADLAISTFGVTTYELLYLGLPIISIGHCEENSATSQILAENCKQIFDAGNFINLTELKFDNILTKAIHNCANIVKKRCLVDELGSTRVTEIIYDLVNN